MDTEQSWRVIAEERRTLADLLDGLSDEEWAAPSLCAGWRIRDVAAHVAAVPQPPSVGSLLVAGVRARGNFHRLNTDVSVRYADARTARQLVAELREHADSRRMPAVTNHRNILFDILVHGQDIALPLGRPRAMPLAAARAGVVRVWTMGWPFWAKRHLRGLRLVATDIEWSAGTGEEVSGPIQALLLLVTGRVGAAAPALSGPGADRLGPRRGGDVRS
jgi:uncharacterized protein (TIGR03083 family)